MTGNCCLAPVLSDRQWVSGDWLFYEIAPDAIYLRDRDFTTGSLCRLEKFFGRCEGTRV